MGRQIQIIDSLHAIMKREAGANLYVMQLKLKKERMGTRRHVM
jgi:hypothetical protein